jgi:hypothetical protein
MWTEITFVTDSSSVTFQEISGPLAYLEKWPLFLPFSCYNMQMQYQKQNLIWNTVTLYYGGYILKYKCR